jgi:UbiD family decarboxylase
VMQGAPYKVVKTPKGLDVPWGSEYVLEGRILTRQREIEGPFGEFPGYTLTLREPERIACQSESSGFC